MEYNFLLLEDNKLSIQKNEHETNNEWVIMQMLYWMCM